MAGIHKLIDPITKEIFTEDQLCTNKEAGRQNKQDNKPNTFVVQV